LKKFNFKLEKVLMVRRSREKEAQRVFAQALEIYEAENHKYILFDQQTKKSWQNITRLQAGRLDPIAITLAYNNLVGQQRIQELQKEKVELALRKLNEKRAVLIEAQRKRKIMEKLKEKQYQKYLYIREKEEQKFIDETVIIKAGRKVLNY